MWGLQGCGVGNDEYVDRCLWEGGTDTSGCQYGRGGLRMPTGVVKCGCRLV